MMYATVKKTLVSFSDDLTICMKATTARSNIRSFTTSEEISDSRDVQGRRDSHPGGWKHGHYPGLDLKF